MSLGNFAHVVSIQFSASLMIFFLLRPTVEIGAPIMTSIVPGCFFTVFFFQKTPALCATGIIGQSASKARAAPVCVNRPFSPTAVRVPSGKNSTHHPSLIFF